MLVVGSLSPVQSTDMSELELRLWESPAVVQPNWHLCSVVWASCLRGMKRWHPAMSIKHKFPLIIITLKPIINKPSCGNVEEWSEECKTFFDVSLIASVKRLSSLKVTKQEKKLYALMCYEREHQRHQEAACVSSGKGQICWEDERFSYHAGLRLSGCSVTKAEMLWYCEKYDTY